MNRSELRHFGIKGMRWGFRTNNPRPTREERLVIRQRLKAERKESAKVQRLITGLRLGAKAAKWLRTNDHKKIPALTPKQSEKLIKRRIRAERLNQKMSDIMAKPKNAARLQKVMVGAKVLSATPYVGGEIVRLLK